MLKDNDWRFGEETSTLGDWKNEHKIYERKKNHRRNYDLLKCFTKSLLNDKRKQRKIADHSWKNLFYDNENKKEKTSNTRKKINKQK